MAMIAGLCVRGSRGTATHGALQQQGTPRGMDTLLDSQSAITDELSMSSLSDVRGLQAGMAMVPDERETLLDCIVWNSDPNTGHAIGITDIDQHHEVLVDLVNQLAAFLRQFSELELARGGRVKGGDLEETMEGLVTYCMKSLPAEEVLLDAYDYTERDEHKVEHERLTEMVCLTYKAVSDEMITIEEVAHLLLFLKEWLAIHIPLNRRYAHHLHEKGANAVRFS
eukprot:Sspe_Gene.91051::Locus_62526_Transcript_2_2_Confidence_0.750_Length_1531::g.91051::m.91051/K07216/K07216; hemerythrin